MTQTNDSINSYKENLAGIFKYATYPFYSIPALFALFLFLGVSAKDTHIINFLFRPILILAAVIGAILLLPIGIITSVLGLLVASVLTVFLPFSLTYSAIKDYFSSPVDENSTTDSAIISIPTTSDEKNSNTVEDEHVYGSLFDTNNKQNEEEEELVEQNVMDLTL